MRHGPHKIPHGWTGMHARLGKLWVKGKLIFWISLLHLQCFNFMSTKIIPAQKTNHDNDAFDFIYLKKHTFSSVLNKVFHYLSIFFYHDTDTSPSFELPYFLYSYIFLTFMFLYERNIMRASCLSDKYKCHMQLKANQDVFFFLLVVLQMATLQKTLCITGQRVRNTSMGLTNWSCPSSPLQIIALSRRWWTLNLVRLFIDTVLYIWYN